MKSLKSLSDRSLLNQLTSLVKKEKDLTCEILLHLIEVENRKIYRALGYGSMFVYCTDGLGYSESSAQRRICAARAIRKCPEAYNYLRVGRVNLATLALVWKYITPELLGEIRGKSYRQVQTIVSRFNPMIKHRDLTRPLAVRKPVEAKSGNLTAGAPRESQPAGALNGSCGLALSVPEHRSPILGEISHRRGGKKPTTSEEPTPEVKLETVKMHQVNCLVEDEVMQMIERCKELMSGKYPTGMDYNTIMKELVSEWLTKHDPDQRAERREKRKTKSKTGNHDSAETSRHISPETRDAVYNRDGGRCTFVGSDGKRCESKWDLEIHHDEVPFALGGSHSLANLRLLCSTHNRLEADRVYGQDHMKKYYKCKNQKE